jgi:protein-export membrane protein SecD
VLFRSLYRTLGVVAFLSLLVFGTLVMTIVSLLGRIGFALTLAGVAGIIVSVGITADSSILFIERLRDEMRLGKTVRSATVKGFASAFRTNLAGNTVTFAAAVILYVLAVGPVRGFALTLGLATLLDIAILYFFTRPVVFLLARGGRIKRQGQPVTVAAAAEGAGR